MARRVKRDPVREHRPDVGDTEYVDEELAQLIDARGDTLHCSATSASSPA